MSIKNNTTSLQGLLEAVNALPEAENLDAELSAQTELLSEQDAKIAELAEILATKTGNSAGGSGGSGGSGVETITIDCSTILPEPGAEIIYVDGTMTLRREELYPTVYTIMKNSIFATSGYMDTAIGGCSSIIGSSMCRIFLAVK